MEINLFGLQTMQWTEILAFVTGAATVWLCVKENVWNWPIGILNGAFFVILFYNTQLYADMSLNVLYVILGFLGWGMWLWGGKNFTALKVQNIGWKESLFVVAAVLIGTVVMYRVLLATNDSAPFLDALTTAISLGAQYMLTRKQIENWYLWIIVDIIYVPLYMYKELPLTAILYVIFLIMCVRGLVLWQRTRTVNTTKVTNELVTA